MRATIPSANLGNINNLRAKGEAKLEKAVKTAEKTVPQKSSKAEKFADKVTNFNQDELKTMEEKLGKYPDEHVSKIKEIATSLLHELGGVLGVAIEEVGKEMGHRVKHTVAAGIKDIGQELLGKENYQSLVSVLRGLRSGVKHFDNFIAEVKADENIAQARTGAVHLATELRKAYYRQ